MSDIYEELLNMRQEGVPAILVTAVEKSGLGPAEVGKKMLVGTSGKAFGTVGGGALEYAAREKCKTLLIERKSTLIKYVLDVGKVVEEATTLDMVCGGAVSLFYEYVGTCAHIYIFGGGHVGQAVCNVLKTMNYTTTVVDERAPIIEAFIGADRKFNIGFTEFIEQEGIEEGSYVVVCTPSHQYDYNVIHKVLELGLKPKYIGMLCSSAKLNDYLNKTYEAYGKNIDLSHFYSPIGLDLGGASPEEIAISIAAEILALQYNKKGHKHMSLNKELLW